MKVYISSLIVIGILLVSGCTTNPSVKSDDWSTAGAVQKPELGELQSIIEEDIRARMIEPDSTRFTNWSELFKDKDADKIEPGGVWSLCVDVTGKYRMCEFGCARTWVVGIREMKVVSLNGAVDNIESHKHRSWCNDNIPGH
jgi:hypothetical protein